MRYSTYRSIYENDTEMNSTDQRRSVWGNSLKLQDLGDRLVNVLMGLLRQDLLMKFALVFMLVISCFTIVGNVFAGTVSSIKQEKRIVVERGDTLWSIAHQNKPADMKTVVYIEGIKQSNGLDDSGIHAGDVLTLPTY
ncbi:LysM peptidoglycan-binding domain-containing protein [Paenibacillus albidus]|nr:LysM peptidoglycan-binding domain-containing protein [Paenibacillus albidus]